MKDLKKVLMITVLLVFAGVMSGCGMENVSIGHRMVLKKALGDDKGRLELRNPGLNFYNPITWDDDGTYDLRTQTYEMTGKGTGSKGGKDERLEVSGRGGRAIWISAYFRYHLEPERIADLHRTVGPEYETILIHPYIQKVTKNCTTRRYTAFEALAGETRGALQEEIINVLKFGEPESRTEIDKSGDTEVFYTGKVLPPQLTERGVTFEDFGIINIEVDPEYQALVNQKQDAKERQEIAERKTAEFQQLALQKQAEAEAGKLERIKKAEAGKAEAVIAAEGRKLAMFADAEGILAKGKAEANAKQLMLEAYAGEGGRRFAEIKKAEALGAGIQKIYYIPSTMSLNTIAKDFEGAIAIGLPGSKEVAPAVKEATPAATAPKAE